MKAKLGLKLRSSAFKDGERIPERYSCNGENLSPPLSWDINDKSIKSWALIVDDPDAARGEFTHWVIYNLPADTNELSEGVPAVSKLPNGAFQGKNDAMTDGYTGPCPPPGPAHHYHFTLYALDSTLQLPAQASRKQLLDTLKGHIVNQGKLIGLYSR